MLTKEWWAKNIGGVCFAVFVSLLLYAASAYITTTVSREMHNYLQLQTWNQWAQERGEWRGRIDGKIETMEKELRLQREQTQNQLFALDKKQEVATAQLSSKIDTLTVLINAMRDDLRGHMNEKKP